MNYLPVCLNLESARILIVGGGNVARQKLKGLLPFTREVTVCAPEIHADIKGLPVSILEREYSSELLEGVSLVYACTDNSAVNRRIREDAHAKKVLVNVADNPTLGDFISPAICRNGDMTIAVNSNGRDIRKTVRWRNLIEAFLEEWE